MDHRQRYPAAFRPWVFPVLLLALTATPGSLYPGPAGSPPSATLPPHVPGEILLRFRDDAPDRLREEVRRGLGARRVSRFRAGAERWKLPPGLGVESALIRLHRDRHLKYAEPNYWIDLAAVPSDPRYPEQYGLNNTGQTGGTPGADIRAERAWDLSTGDGVLVAIIDTGVDDSHPDLAANLWTNPGEIPGNGIDDDQNGLVDDTRGWDFENQDSEPFDDHGHGTHVAGIVAAAGNNGEGTIGVAPRARILPIKFMNFQGRGSVANATAAVDYAARMGARVINASWGSSFFSQTLFDAVQTAGDAQVLLVAAAGNSSTDSDVLPFYPAGFDAPGVLAVAATDHSDRLAPFSSYGAASVDIAAPGTAILSALPEGRYGYLSGTSMATPHVAGAAALVLAMNPELGVVELRQRLLHAADRLPQLAGKVATGGRLNAFLAVNAPESDPPAPVTDLRVEASTSSTVILTWTAPGDDLFAGTAFAYDLRYAAGPIDPANPGEVPSARGLPPPRPAGTGERFEIAGLQPDTDYSFLLLALDEWGNVSAPGNLVSARTLPPPTFASTPASFSASLRVGETASRLLSLANTGAGTLDFSIPPPSVGASFTPLAESLPLLKGEADPRQGGPVPEGSGGPDGFGYRFTDSDTPGGPPFEWNDLSHGGTPVPALTLDDEMSPPIPLGFEFPFYGARYTAVRICTNGWLTFSGAPPVFTNQPLPSLGAPPLLIAPLWDDLDFGGLARAAFLADGERFTVQFTGVSHFGGAGRSTFQVTLDPSGRIDFRYLDLGSAEDGATVGIQDGTRTTGLQVAFNQAYLHPGLAIRIERTPQWIRASPDRGRLPAGAGQEIEVTLDASYLRGGAYQGTISVETNDPLHPRVDHPVQLQVADAPLLRAHPRPLDFGSIYQGYPAVRTLGVRNIGTLPLTVFEARSDDPALAIDPASLTLAPGAGADLQVTLTPAGAAAIDSEIILRSDSTIEPLLTIPVRGTVVPPPVLGVSPASIAASLASGESTVLPLRLENSGGSRLDYRAIIVPAADPGPLCRPARALVSEYQAGRLFGIDLLTGITSILAEGLNGPRIGVVPAPGRDVVYVAEGPSGEISSVDLDTGETRLLATGLQWPEGLAPRPGGSELLISEYEGGELSSLDVESGRVRLIASGFDRPAGLFLGADNRTLWLAETGRGTVLALDLFRGSWTRLTGGLSAPRGLSLDSSGTTLYVTETNGGRLTAVDTTTGETRTVAAGLQQPTGVVLTPDGTSALVAESVAGRIARIDVVSGAIERLPSDLGLPLGVALDVPPGCRSEFLSLESGVGSLAPGGTAEIPIHLSAAAVLTGTYRAGVEIGSNDPTRPRLTVPVSLDVQGRSAISISRDPIRVESSRDFAGSEATTRHTLPLPAPPAKEGRLEVRFQGSFSDPADRVTVFAEGYYLGSAASTLGDCDIATGLFPLSPELLAILAADGSLGVEVRNSPEVSATCPVNRHVVHLEYPIALEPIDFGALFVGVRRDLTLQVRNRGTGRLVVSSIATDQPEFSVSRSSLSLDPGRMARLTVGFTPSAARSFSGRLRLDSNDPATGRIDLELRGTGSLAPVVGVDPAALERRLETGTQETTSLTVTNRGASTLTFTAALEPADGEGLPSAGLSLESATGQILPAGPVPLTALVEDPATDRLYAQARDGFSFFRLGTGSGVWEVLPSAPLAATGGGGAAFLNGRIYTGYPQESLLLGQYDPVAGSWTTLPNPLGAATANITSDGRRYLYLASFVRVLRFDPASGEAEFLPQPPFPFTPTGGLRYFEGALYGHRGGGWTDFARYDLTAERWTSLPPLPSPGGGFGAAVDPMSREYLASPIGATDYLLRYSFDDRAWRTRPLSGFEEADGGIAWLPRPSPAIYLVEGKEATGLLRLPSGIDFVSLGAQAGSVAPGGAFALPVRFDARKLPPGIRKARIRIDSNDPARPQLIIPVSLEIPEPSALSITAATASLESTQDYDPPGGRTFHRLRFPAPPAGGGWVEVEAEGDYPAIPDALVVVADGVRIGAAAGPGQGCGPWSARFPLGSSELLSLAADDELVLEIRASPAAAGGCPANRHRVRLSYAVRADRLDFGTQFVGQSRTLELKLVNLSLEDFSVQTASSDATQFHPTSGPLAIPAGGSTLLRVEFAPIRDGSFTPTLTLTEARSRASPVMVPMSGSGVPPPAVDIKPASVSATVVSGTRDALTFRVTNGGPVPLRFSLALRHGTSSLAWREGDCAPSGLRFLDPGSGAIARLDFPGGAPEPMVPAPEGATTMALDPSGEVAYVAAGWSGTLWEVDLAGGATRLVATGLEEPAALVYDPVRGIVYAVERLTGRLLAVHVASGIITPVAFGLRGPAALLLAEGRSVAWVAERATGSLAMVDLSEGSIRRRIDGLGDPVAIDRDPLEKTIYVADGQGRILRIDPVTGDRTQIPSPVADPTGIVLAPEGNTLFVVSSSSGEIRRVDLSSGESQAAATGLTAILAPALAVPPECTEGPVVPGPWSGIVPPAGTRSVEIGVDARHLASGIHDAEIRVRSNDPLRPEVSLPVRITVECSDAADPAPLDSDADGIGDACDACTDRDGDGAGDRGFSRNTCPPDNCPAVANPDQADANSDGAGDACQPRLEIAGWRSKAPALIEVRVALREPQGHPVSSLVRVLRETASGPSTVREVRQASGLPRSIPLDGLGPPGLYRLHLEVSNGETPPVPAEVTFSFAGEDRLFLKVSPRPAPAGRGRHD